MNRHATAFIAVIEDVSAIFGKNAGVRFKRVHTEYTERTEKNETQERRRAICLRVETSHH
jgi:hypothetical protein